MKELESTIDYLKKLDPEHASRRLLIVLGSGWGNVVDAVMDIEGSVNYPDLPGFPVSTVEGHAGRLVWGTIAGVPVTCMQGRFHYYEGYTLQQVTYPLRVFSALGIRGVLLTNAAGGIRAGLRPGGLMLIEDHINLMGANPLMGPNLDQFGTRFPDMTAAYDPELQACMEESAAAGDIKLDKGVYLAVSGPSFETPAEIKAFAGLGADAVGMSTVPECIVARHCGMRVAGLSCITNLAAHAGGAPLTHEEVAEAARSSHDSVIRLFQTAIPALHKSLGS
ncbi:MAG: purine-nucleoside phosphorylase [Puniceicoccaceae bacterium]